MMQVFLNGKIVPFCKGYDLREGWVRCLLPDTAEPTDEQKQVMKILPDLVRVKLDSNGKPIDIFKYGKVEVRDITG